MQGLCRIFASNPTQCNAWRISEIRRECRVLCRVCRVYSARFTYIVFARKDRLSGYDSFSALAANPPIFFARICLPLVVQYLISSPNHNHNQRVLRRQPVVQYLISSPNHNWSVPDEEPGRLFSILFHHQTTTIHEMREICESCLVSYFITKPQRQSESWRWTSVVQYLISSPNHNLQAVYNALAKLFSILFHHQTTTSASLILSSYGCLVSYFITKPQHRNESWRLTNVVQYLISSPNHNLRVALSRRERLFSILFHHQTTTDGGAAKTLHGCLVSYFITKPQLRRSRYR